VSEEADTAVDDGLEGSDEVVFGARDRVLRSGLPSSLLPLDDEMGGDEDLSEEAEAELASLRFLEELLTSSIGIRC
jgi:hypothetical protein